MITKGYVDTSHGQVHFRMSQTSEPVSAPLVFFHMTADTSESFENVMTELAGRVTTVAFDTPNYGESFRTDREPTIEFISGIMLEALDQLGFERFHTFGHHTGASIALELVHRHPERALSATLNGMVAVTEAEGLGYLDSLVWPNPPSTQGAQIMAAWTRALTLEPHYLDFPAEIKNRVVHTMLKSGEDWSWAYRAVFTDDAMAKLVSATRPLFFLIGKFDASLDVHLRSHSLVPSSRSHVDDTFGMFYCENSPADVAERVLPFLIEAEEVGDGQA
ncbi:alpha/beta fold hydrolase [Aeromicrobium sp. Leaf350]|uniref:alpha/beta fold hydrolase n=1 Tax=Aeromicrobium sp. Leaf350 TaxID=2876565 RepID=UPI001E3171FD|nr:alpha/beta hydrolase [Aeromicrobium sp. Leaf350]